MSCILFPTNFIWWEKVEDHSSVKQKYLQKIKLSEENVQKKHEWDCNVSTSFGNDYVNNSIFDKDFRDNVIWKYFDKIIENKPFSFDNPEASIIKEIWYNTYVPGQYQEVHCHSDISAYKHGDITTMTMFSGIYLIDLHEKNKTVFYQQGPFPCMVKNRDGYYVHTFDIEEGNILFFPSSLSHYVSPAEKSRTTISFNIQCSYKI
jgi:hypothetical protein